MQCYFLYLIPLLCMFSPYAFRELAGVGTFAASAECWTLSSLLAKVSPASNLAAASRNALNLLSELENEVRARHLSQLT